MYRITEYLIDSEQRHIRRMMSGGIVRGSGLMTLLDTINAKQSVAMFLVNHAARMKACDYSALSLHLRMTREEIENYLGAKTFDREPDALKNAEKRWRRYKR
jgi:hypothetical protein